MSTHTTRRSLVTKLVAVAAVVLLLAAGCTGSDDEDAGPLRIAIVAPSASNDLAFSQSMVDAVNAVGETREIEVAVTDGTFIVEEAAAAIRGYAEDGFDLVIAHGSQYGGPLEEIAPDFPDTSFAWGNRCGLQGLGQRVRLHGAL